MSYDPLLALELLLEQERDYCNKLRAEAEQNKHEATETYFRGQLAALDTVDRWIKKLRGPNENA